MNSLATTISAIFGYAVHPFVRKRFFWETLPATEFFSTLHYSRPSMKSPPAVLRFKYLNEVFYMAKTSSEKDTLVLVMAGHGEPGGVFKIGEGNNDEDSNEDCNNNEDHNDEEGKDAHQTKVENQTKLENLTRAELEMALGETKATVWLINTTCYSGAWESPKWTLLAAAQADEEPPSLAVSASNKGEFFANALMAQHANEFNLVAPCPASVDDNGSRGQQHPHDFGPGRSVRPSRSIPKRSLHDVREWIHDWRDRIGRVYTSASVCFSPSCIRPGTPLHAV